MTLTVKQAAAIAKLRAAGTSGVLGPALVNHPCPYDELEALRAKGLVRIEVRGGFLRWFLAEQAPSAFLFPEPDDDQGGAANGARGEPGTGHRGAFEKQSGAALPYLEPMARTRDPGTSHVAAALVAPALGKIQRQVLAAFQEHGPMTARRAERLPCFERYGFSTIRKRISELARAGLLSESGVEKEGRVPATVYAAREES